MEFSDYQDFRVAVRRFVEGDDLSGNTFSHATLDLMVGLGETRAYRDLRASTMVTALALAPVSGVYTLPAGLIELKELYFDATRPIELIELSELHRLGNMASNGNAVYAAQNGEKLEFFPSSTTGTVYGSYYAKPAPLATITWANATTLARYPEVFIYAALAEAMPFIGFDSRLPMWKRLYSEAVMAANSEEMNRGFGGSRLRMRSR